MSDILDPWGSAQASTANDLLDPWDAAVQQQTQSPLPTAALPSAPMPSQDAPIPLLDNDLKTPTDWRPPAPAPAPVAAPATKETPMSTYVILAGIVGGLGYMLWRMMESDKRGGAADLNDLDLGEMYALPISDSSYVTVEEVKKEKTKTRVRFPESGAEIWIATADLIGEKDAQKQGLKEKD